MDSRYSFADLYSDIFFEIIKYLIHDRMTNPLFKVKNTFQEFINEFYKSGENSCEVYKNRLPNFRLVCKDWKEKIDNIISRDGKYVERVYGNSHYFFDIDDDIFGAPKIYLHKVISGRFGRIDLNYLLGRRKSLNVMKNVLFWRNAGHKNLIANEYTHIEWVSYFCVRQRGLNLLSSSPPFNAIMNGDRDMCKITLGRDSAAEIKYNIYIEKIGSFYSPRLIYRVDIIYENDVIDPAPLPEKIFYNAADEKPTFMVESGRITERVIDFDGDKFDYSFIHHWKDIVAIAARIIKDYSDSNKFLFRMEDMINFILKENVRLNIADSHRSIDERVYGDGIIVKNTSVDDNNINLIALLDDTLNSKR